MEGVWNCAESASVDGEVSASVWFALDRLYRDTNAAIYGRGRMGI